MISKGFIKAVSLNFELMLMGMRDGNAFLRIANCFQTMTCQINIVHRIGHLVL